ncbi:competence protein CoiA family protein [Kitasatospora purpeofusca]|uniref:competence protein CoiA family protein n=1 Tax=Kitasatospora purpeofusca TaxID=67352 RepID=UPI002254845A|nr:hypothetical protein [Kitasatospora purpeofusca]MCX4682734.1 hypothetical protein [Kitasatospora purpeofusca]MCX4690602.1 hypothetical protein [Kitasatospora purpeofusca]MCX4690784.1 hypothetical protein [Kitasatospora purpeofusca]
MGEQTSAPWVYDRVTNRWVDLSRGVAGLQSGEAGGRYVCRACRENLMLRSVNPGTVNRPHFSHRRGTECSAAPAVREQLELDDRIVIEFQQRITRAWPGAHCVLEFPGGLDEGGVEGPLGVLPPAVVVRGGPGGRDVSVVERPRRPVDIREVQERIRTVRARYGAGVRHVWFWAGDVLQSARLAELRVAPRGRPKTRHATIAPTAQQLAVVVGGGRVYFLDGAEVLVPYGVHDFEHEWRAAEDWDFPDWRHGFRRDWRISRPVPAADASRWGLAPVAFEELTSTRGVFALSAANDLLLALEQAQGGRWRYRRNEAARLYRERRRPPLPAEPRRSTAPQADPAPTPLPAAGAEPAPPAAAALVEPVATAAPARPLEAVRHPEAAVPDGTTPRAPEPEVTAEADCAPGAGLPTDDSVYLAAPVEPLTVPTLPPAPPRPAVPPKAPPLPLHPPTVGPHRTDSPPKNNRGWLRRLLDRP